MREKRELVMISIRIPKDLQRKVNTIAGKFEMKKTQVYIRSIEEGLLWVYS